MSSDCQTYWGSHGCELEQGHDGWHYCGDESGPCCKLSPDDSAIAHWDDACREWFTPNTFDPTLVSHG